MLLLSTMSVGYLDAATTMPTVYPGKQWTFKTAAEVGWMKKS
jgi:hypothetical protein